LKERGRSQAEFPKQKGILDWRKNTGIFLIKEPENTRWGSRSQKRVAETVGVTVCGVGNLFGDLCPRGKRSGDLRSGARKELHL